MVSIPSPKPVIGQRYGFLTVLDEGERRATGRFKKNTPTFLLFVRFLCDCGNEKCINWQNVKRGLTLSCGCHHRKRASEACTKHGDVNSLLHKRWMSMRNRCKTHKDYVGRGISVCPEWDDYAVFQAWALATGYRDDLQIDRRNNDGNYSPDNCRWVDRFTNMQNTRSARNITAFGETKCLHEWARDERCAVTIMAIHQRIERGWNPEDAISLPPKSAERDSKGIFRVECVTG